MALKEERIEEIEELFELEEIQTCFRVIDKAYAEKVSLAELRLYLGGAHEED